MKEYNNEINNINEENNKEYYSNAFGTGVLSSIIFIVITIILMYFFAKFIGN